jgi:putative hemolysin
VDATEVVRDVAIVAAFVLIGGFFAAAEMALVTLREGQARTLAARGRRGQRVVRLTQDPNRFLSAVQIGTTVATLFSGAFGAATLTGEVAPELTRMGLAPGVAEPFSLVVITLVISYFSLVLGELAPKRVALQRAEGVSLLAAPLLDRMAALSRPVIWLLSRSTNVAVRIMGADPQAARAAMSVDELRALVSGYTELSIDERTLIEEVFAARGRPVREVLVPRTEVMFLDAETSVSMAAVAAAAMPYSRFPVCRDSHDDVIGFVHVRDLLTPRTLGEAAAEDARPVAEVTRSVKFLPATLPLLIAMSQMRREGSHLAVVMDEYGGTAGIVTLEDLVEEVIGDIRDEYDVEDAQARRLRGGAIEVDGLINLDDFARETGIRLPPGPYETVAGFVLAVLGRIPGLGETVEVSGYRVSVTELDGLRVARLRVTPISVPDAG